MSSKTREKKSSSQKFHDSPTCRAKTKMNSQEKQQSCVFAFHIPIYMDHSIIFLQFFGDFSFFPRARAASNNIFGGKRETLFFASLPLAKMAPLGPISPLPLVFLLSPQRNAPNMESDCRKKRKTAIATSWLNQTRVLTWKICVETETAQSLTQERNYLVTYCSNLKQLMLKVLHKKQ